MTLKCDWSGKEFEGKAIHVQTSEGMEIVSPEAYFSGRCGWWEREKTGRQRQEQERKEQERKAELQAKRDRVLSAEYRIADIQRQQEEYGDDVDARTKKEMAGELASARKELAEAKKEEAAAQ